MDIIRAMARCVKAVRLASLLPAGFTVTAASANSLHLGSKLLTAALVGTKQDRVTHIHLTEAFSKLESALTPVFASLRCMSPVC